MDRDPARGNVVVLPGPWAAFRDGKPDHMVVCLEARMGDLVLSELLTATRWRWFSVCSAHQRSEIDGCATCRQGSWGCVEHNDHSCKEC